MKFISIILLIIFICSCNQIKTNEDKTTANPAEQTGDIYVDDYNLNLGDIGTSGGYIFYVNLNADIDGWKYMEMIGSIQVLKWGLNFFNVNDTTRDIGSGYNNTYEIISKDSYSNKAADYCYNIEFIYNGITYSDCFLPSLDELNMIYENLYLKNIGGLSNDIFWSSTEKDGRDAFAMNFNTGNILEIMKETDFYVLPVRKY